jgi:3'(2'), 5'-bisphosphate nucleotidase
MEFINFNYKINCKNYKRNKMPTLSNKSLIEMRNIIAEISLQASNTIMQNINSPIEIKKDNTPVTKADKESDKLINKLLYSYYPNIPIVSEEREYPKNSFGDNLHWIIDPLDGTKSFIEGHEDFCVCIALSLNKKPILGCIAHPPSEKIWIGGARIGSCVKEQDSNYKDINCRNIPKDGPTIAISRHHAGPILRDWLSSIIYVKEKRVGSALKFSLIAEGKADIFPRTTSTYEWDSAAGQAIIEGAGGKVTQMNNNEMVYGRQDKKNPNFIAFGKSNWVKFLKAES